jgi:hypothetical protein
MSKTAKNWHGRCVVGQYVAHDEGKDMIPRKRKMILKEEEDADADADADAEKRRGEEGMTNGAKKEYDDVEGSRP